MPYCGRKHFNLVQYTMELNPRHSLLYDVWVVARCCLEREVPQLYYKYSFVFHEQLRRSQIVQAVDVIPISVGRHVLCATTHLPLC